MKLTSFWLLAFFSALAQSQEFPECTRELLRTDDCAAVVNPSACYNQFRWNTRTLGCIEGENDTERKMRACKCCSCVGTVMCNWARQNRYCSG
ncbi:hypothetical protein N657DRAFT_563760 [Parathielavia appendiculata]|uniref:Uncharacterized protein n=1 Tax=Parathielavia appendiculata TaxID=2587402 RepID=A0AAN6Z8H9_9PEZI|nr:hypothetical protein N657DRAFT_563760 [Parathielavia appendiculata]